MGAEGIALIMGLAILLKMIKLLTVRRLLGIRYGVFLVLAAGFLVGCDDDDLIAPSLSRTPSVIEGVELTEAKFVIGEIELVTDRT